MNSEILHPNKKAFLAAYSRVASISRAAKIAKIDRNTHYQWMSDDPAYKKAFEAAKPLAADYLEDVAIRRATTGKEPSDTLLIFLLKGHKPEKFRERYSAEVSGPGGKPIEMSDVSERAKTLTAEELEAAIVLGRKLKPEVSE